MAWYTSENGITCGSAPMVRRLASSTLLDGMRIFSPFRSSGFRSGLFAENT